jgi:uncharacterized protein YneR
MMVVFVVSSTNMNDERVFLVDQSHDFGYFDGHYLKIAFSTIS